MRTTPLAMRTPRRGLGAQGKFAVVQPVAILGGPGGRPTPIDAYTQILCIPWMDVDQGAGHAYLIEAVQRADLVICKAARILKDRHGIRSRAATIEELFAVHETIYLTE
jgi:hypothetical protein